MWPRVFSAITGVPLPPPRIFTVRAPAPPRLPWHYTFCTCGPSVVILCMRCYAEVNLCRCRARA